MSFLTHPLISVIQLYQRVISPGLPRRCRYEPTCSAYGIKSLQIHGFFKGILLILWRITRCNPWSKGGVDRVPARGQWPKKPLGYRELMAERAGEDES
ncbi:membrane protein insertion efficiency factor YidD [Arcanobacterium hippocoleae]